MDSTSFKHLTTKEKNQALKFAAAYGDIHTVKILIETGNIDLDHQDNFGRTALIWAAKNKCSEIISMLINAGANIEIEDYHGQTSSMLINANDPEEDKENKSFIYQNLDFPFKHPNCYNPITFSANAPLRQKNHSNNKALAVNQLHNVTNTSKRTNNNCRVM